MRSYRSAVLQALVLSVAILAADTAPQAAPSDRVLVVNVDGAISVAAARQISRAVEQAKREKATAIVVRLDTPGGLVSATRDIIRDMIAAPVPMIVYVARVGGARPRPVPSSSMRRTLRPWRRAPTSALRRQSS